MNFKTKIQGPVAIIGDLHGQSSKLQTVFERLRHWPEFEYRWVIFIGDFVDRGPDTRTTIDMVLEFAQEHARTTAIMGNHEFALCSAMGWFNGAIDANWSQKWIDFYNSDKTFLSYGVAPGDLDGLAARIPDSHREFLINLPWCVEHPQLLFVHAGLDPNLPFDVQMRILQQRDFSLTRPQWLCEKAYVGMDPPSDCPFAVVSGHVKVDEVVIESRRILVDTTGGDSGHLSCVLMPEQLVISSNPDELAPIPAGPRRSAAPAPSQSSWWKIWK